MKIIKYPLAVLTVIFIVKLLTVLYLVHLSRCTSPQTMTGLATLGGDTYAYLSPIENFIKEGHYYSESAQAGRMPYLGLVYLPFYLLFSKPVAVSIVVILQVLMETIAIYYTAKLCAKVLNNEKAFLVFIILSLLSLYVTIYDLCILSESFGISFLCLFAYHYYVFLSQRRTNKQLLITGIFLALSVLFKPYFSSLFLLIGTEFLWHHRRQSIAVYIKNTIRSVLIVSLPLVVANAPWTIRNYMVMNKFIPFQQNFYAGVNYTPANLKVWEFIQTIGESIIYWDKRSAGCYFEPKPDLACEYQFPERIFSANLTMEKIENAKAVYLEYQNRPTDSLEKLTIQKFDALIEIYKKESAFSYYLISPVMLCKNFLFHSGSYYLPVKKDSVCYHPVQWLLKMLQSLLYYIALFIGFTGAFIMLFKNAKSFIVFAIPAYLVLLFPLLLKATEFRFFHPAYPFLLIGSTYVIFEIKKYFLKK